jgi:hypothetical protein
LSKHAWQGAARAGSLANDLSGCDLRTGLALAAVFLNVPSAIDTDPPSSRIVVGAGFIIVVLTRQIRVGAHSVYSIVESDAEFPVLVLRTVLDFHWIANLFAAGQDVLETNLHRTGRAWIVRDDTRRICFLLDTRNRALRLVHDRATGSKSLESFCPSVTPMQRVTFAPSSARIRALVIARRSQHKQERAKDQVLHGGNPLMS